MVKMGEKMLGYLAEQRRVSGVKSQVLQRVMPDGSVVRAQFVRDQPLVEILSPPAKPLEPPVDIDGFVTWPTDADGELAIPASPRVVIAGPQYRAVHKARYASLFPDVVDDDLGTHDGLGRAGNVDWHGKKNGWLLSWYGPRTRYFDPGTILKPWIYFKGKELLDARDYVDIDATILGAAVTDDFGGPWLIFVVEEFFFARYERVCAIKLIGKPTDARVEVDPDSFVELESRNPDDFNPAKHPWFFNPDGTEGRMLTEGESFSDTVIFEHIIRLVESGDPPGFTVEREDIEHPLVDQVWTTGYTDASYGYFVGKAKNRRRVPVLYADIGLPDNGDSTTEPDGTTIVKTGNFFVESGDGAYQVSIPALLDYTNVDNITVSGDVWQPIAVDYKANGEVVYGYGRVASKVRSTVGHVGLDSATEFDIDFSDTSWTATATAASGLWLVSASYTDDYEHNGIACGFTATETTTEETVIGGLRVGSIEVLYGRTATSSVVAQHQFSTAGNSISVGPGIIDDDTGFGSPGPVTATDIHASGGAVSPTLLFDSTDTSEAEEQELFLARMDLRYEALFIVVSTKTDIQSVEQTMSYINLGSGGVRPDGSGHMSISTASAKQYQTQGWIHGNQVLNDSVYAYDNRGSPDVVDSDTLPALYSSFGAYVSFITLCSWYDDVSDSTTHGNSWVTYPWLTTGLTVGSSLVTGTIPPFPHPYAGPVQNGYTVDPDLFAEDHTEHPYTQQLLMSWQSEVDAGAGVVGYSFGSIGTRVKIRWKRDLDSIGDAGGWGFFNTRWAVSMALPAPEAEGEPFRFFSECGGLDLAQHVLEGDETAEHFYPIWVLPATTGFRPK